jgi:hypothetical protein
MEVFQGAGRHGKGTEERKGMAQRDMKSSQSRLHSYLSVHDADDGGPEEQQRHQRACSNSNEEPINCHG